MPPVSDAEIESFMRSALSRAGAEEMVTPREIIRDFLTVLNILRDNKNISFDSLVKNLSFSRAEENELGEKIEQGEIQNKNKVSLFDIDI